MNILAFATLTAMSEQEQTLIWKLVSLMGQVSGVAVVA